MRILGRLAVLVALMLSLAACGSGHQSVAGNVPARIAIRSDPFHALIAGSTDLGPLSGSHNVSFILLIRDPGAAQQGADLAAMYNPDSRTFGRFLTPRQLQHYGPAPATITRVRAFFRRAGLSTRWQAGASWLTVEGPAPAVDHTFHVDVHRYVSAGGIRYAASARDPTVPMRLRKDVVSAGRIDTYRERVHTVLRSVPAGGLTPDGLLTAYDLKALRDMGLDGSGETVAFVEIDGFKQPDFDQFTGKFGLPAMSPVVKFGGADSNVQGEAEMDMEVVHEIAPGAKLVVYNCGNCSDAQMSDARDRMAKDNPGAILSDSIGGCELGIGSVNTDADRRAYGDADSLGESAFAASGDSGAFDCLDWGSAPSPSYVAADEPPSVPTVTSVGGTRLSVNRDGTWYREETWENPAETSGSGGAPSQFYARPSWQSAPGVSGDKREEPDVSADADPISSPTVNIGGQFGQVGGTSQAAPIWAGMTALIDQYLRSKGLRRVGFMNPALYALASNPQPYPPFHDITQGGNLFFNAAPGYDLATGLGSPDGWNLARDLEQYIKGGGQ
jgi:kumamolisin